MIRTAAVWAIAAAMAVAALGAGAPSAARAAEALRVGVLQYGTVNWQLDTLIAENLHDRSVLDLKVRNLASKNATSVALQAGDVDIIVSDWIWALRQNAGGDDLAFVPYSTALGAIVLAEGSDLQSVSDLRGKRIGIAGGPLDKSWLVLRAWYRARHEIDLIEDAEPVYAAPPLLSEQLRTGDLDAVLTFWPYAARLEAAGHRRLAGVESLLADLGIAAPQALVGYVFRRALIEARPAALREFFAAIDRTNAVLDGSAAAWERLRPAMKVASDAEFEALKAGYRAGIPAPGAPLDGKAAGQLFEILVSVGGERLVGAGTRFDPGVFLDPNALPGP
ncbi:MAG: transporter substrate-binding domain-containing protein [Kiloniellales bacterium]|nr:transporter substrate-binding domain-containing protein [Kiloniellales bacterium]